MLATDYQRPAHLYLYAERASLQRALENGQFCLQPQGSGASACLTLSFCKVFKPELFQVFDAADSCLVIHECERFGERLHAAVQRVLPDWAGIDGAVFYGSRSPLGKLFSKTREHAHEKEWLFAWRPTRMPAQNAAPLHPVMVEMGSIAQWAELREKDTGSC